VCDLARAALLGDGSALGIERAPNPWATADNAVTFGAGAIRGRNISEPAGSWRFFLFAMTRSAVVPVLVLVASRASGATAAEFTPVAQKPEAAASSAKSTRVVSPAVAGMLAAQTPKFSPPPPISAEAARGAADRREAERPRNGIIRLPSYVVREAKPPVFKERELLTEAGRMDLGFKRHPGLHIGPFSKLNNVWADAMLEEESGIERQKEMYELLGLAGGGGWAPVFAGRPPFALPVALSGPGGGLVVPWERR
jgi:hypothetical protein